MANLPEPAVFEPGVYQLELTDDAEGGADGIINVPARQLASRTRYLFEELERVEAIAALDFLAARNLSAT